MFWSFSGHPRCGHPRTDNDEALEAPARKGGHPTVNEKNRTHLLRPCAATALLNEISRNNSRAKSSATNDEATDSTKLYTRRTSFRPSNHNSSSRESSNSSRRPFDRDHPQARSSATTPDATPPQPTLTQPGAPPSRKPSFDVPSCVPHGEPSATQPIPFPRALYGTPQGDPPSAIASVVAGIPSYP